MIPKGKPIMLTKSPANMSAATGAHGSYVATQAPSESVIGSATTSAVEPRAGCSSQRRSPSDPWSSSVFASQPPPILLCQMTRESGRPPEGWIAWPVSGCLPVTLCRFVTRYVTRPF